MTARKVELITWRDCVSLGGWQYLSDMSGWGGRVITTVGMIVEETDDDLVLAMSTGDASAGELLCNWMSIPKSAIMGRVVLRSNVEVRGRRSAEGAEGIGKRQLDDGPLDCRVGGERWET